MNTNNRREFLKIGALAGFQFQELRNGLICKKILTQHPMNSNLKNCENLLLALIRSKL